MCFFYIRKLNVINVLNVGPAWHASPWKEFTGESPGKYFQNVIEKRKKRLRPDNPSSKENQKKTTPKIKFYKKRQGLWPQSHTTCPKRRYG